MRWWFSFLALIVFWANVASGATLSYEYADDLSLFEQSYSIERSLNSPPLPEKAENRSDYKQVKYSKKLSRYSWLKDKKPKVLSYYNNLSRIVLFNNLPPVNFIIREIFHVSSVDYDHSGNLRLLSVSAWTQNPPDSANRLGGWKESNILYKGSLTYHAASASTI